MQNHRNNLFARVAFEVELRIDELVLGACVDRESWLTSQLCFEMVAPERDFNYGIGSQSVLADVIGERADVERNFAKPGRKLGCAQFRGCMVAVLVQDKSAIERGLIASVNAPIFSFFSELSDLRSAERDRIQPRTH